MSPEQESAEPFSLELAENPHPRMLAEAVAAREHSANNAYAYRRGYWHGYRAAMCAATGEAAEAIEAWMDRQ